MLRTGWLSILRAVLGSGFAISVYQIFQFYDVRRGVAGFGSFCDISERVSCSLVDLSRYAELFADIPVSALAASWFFFALLLSLIVRSPTWRRETLRLLAGLTTAGLAVSLFYLFIMTFIIRALCIPCLCVDALVFLAWLSVYKMQPGKILAAPFHKAQLRTLAIIFGVILITLMGFAKIIDPGKPSVQEVANAVDETLQTPAENLPNLEGLPRIGPANARITIVKFSDFECPACLRAAWALKGVLKKYEKDVAFYYAGFPLDAKCNPLLKEAMHPTACELAKISYCGDRQGKFENLYEFFFSHQSELGKIEPFALLQREKPKSIDIPGLQECMTQSKDSIEVLLRKGIDAGIAGKIESTPTFFVNGHRLLGAYPPDFWDALFKKILAEK